MKSRGRPALILPENPSPDLIRKYNRNESVKKWRQANPDKVLEYHRSEWYKKSKQKYIETHREKYLESMREWHIRNQEHLNRKIVCQVCNTVYAYRRQASHFKSKHHQHCQNSQ